MSYRVVVATHPVDQKRKKTKKKKPVGVTRAGVVYELFFTNLPQQGFTACDVVELYLHRGSFESVRIAMKMKSLIWIAGAAMRPGDRSAGNNRRQPTF
jgi:hypothetical protein